jgi:hypothetical protein
MERRYPESSKSRLYNTTSTDSINTSNDSNNNNSSSSIVAMNSKNTNNNFTAKSNSVASTVKSAANTIPTSDPYPSLVKSVESLTLNQEYNDISTCSRSHVDIYDSGKDRGKDEESEGDDWETEEAKVIDLEPPVHQPAQHQTAYRRASSNGRYVLEFQCKF